MFGILFIILIFGYIWLILKIASKATTLIKLIVYLIAFALPVLYPFAYKHTGAYKEFEALCAASTRTQILKSIKTDIFQTSYWESGYKALHEKSYSSFAYKRYDDYRFNIYTPTDSYKTNECKVACEKYFSKACSTQCLTLSKYTNEAPFLEYKSYYDGKILPSNFISETHKSIERLGNDEIGVIAEKSDYRYYPYGNGFAKILGAASGSAPSINCKEYSQFNYYEITPPIK